ncbi:uncharacterized protein OCT59_002712 [Rhizophagus irregularis]|nr:hypothetical protein OCT59_002712 [Rhizophagus irregularis]
MCGEQKFSNIDVETDEIRLELMLEYCISIAQEDRGKSLADEKMDGSFYEKVCFNKEEQMPEVSPANVPDSDIAQLKHHAPVCEAVPEITVPVSPSLCEDDKKTDEFLDLVQKKSVSDRIRQRNKEKKIQQDNQLDCNLSKNDSSGDDDFTVPSEQALERDLMQQLSLPSTSIDTEILLTPPVIDKKQQFSVTAECIVYMFRKAVRSVYVLSKAITGDHQNPKNNQINASDVLDSAKASVSTAPIPSNHDSNSSSNSSGTDPNKMECLYRYAVKHGLDPEKFSIITEAEKKRWTYACLRGILERDMNFYRGGIKRKEDPRKYYTFLTDRERLIGEELLRRDILKSGLSTEWLDNLMKEWEKIHTQFIQVFAQESSSPKKMDDKVEVVLPFSQPNSPIHDQAYFRNKVLKLYPDIHLHRNGNAGTNDIYRCRTKSSLCPSCGTNHEENIVGYYRNEIGTSGTSYRIGLPFFACNLYSSTFNAERGRIYAEINNKLTAEIGKIKARDDVLTKEAQKILSMVNNIITRLNTIEEACRNDFSAINASIENLQNEMIRQYAVARRIQPVETDQLSMADKSETSNQSHANSSGSSDSGPITFRGISLTVWTRFKQLFDQIRDEKGLNTEEICLLVAIEIRELGGKIKKNTIQGFYERNITKRGGYISTLDDIGFFAI